MKTKATIKRGIVRKIPDMVIHFNVTPKFWNHMQSLTLFWSALRKQIAWGREGDKEKRQKVPVKKMQYQGRLKVQKKQFTNAQAQKKQNLKRIDQDRIGWVLFLMLYMSLPLVLSQRGNKVKPTRPKIPSKIQFEYQFTTFSRVRLILLYFIARVKFHFRPAESQYEAEPYSCGLCRRQLTPLIENSSTGVACPLTMQGWVFAQYQMAKVNVEFWQIQREKGPRQTSLPLVPNCCMYLSLRNPNRGTKNLVSQSCSKYHFQPWRLRPRCRPARDTSLVRNSSSIVVYCQLINNIRVFFWICPGQSG